MTKTKQSIINHTTVSLTSADVVEALMDHAINALLIEQRQVVSAQIKINENGSVVVTIAHQEGWEN